MEKILYSLALSIVALAPIAAFVLWADRKRSRDMSVKLDEHEEQISE